MNSTRSGRRKASSDSCGSFTFKTSAGAAPRVLGDVRRSRARGAVVVVGDTGVRARVPLEEHLHAAVVHLEHTVGCDRDTVFVGFHLARDANVQHAPLILAALMVRPRA